MKMFFNQLIVIGDALSQLLNTVFLRGEANESLSRRCHRRVVMEKTEHRGWKVARLVINGVFFWQNDHCKLAYEKDLERARKFNQYHVAHTYKELLTEDAA